MRIISILILSASKWKTIAFSRTWEGERFWMNLKYFNFLYQGKLLQGLTYAFITSIWLHSNHPTERSLTRSLIVFKLITKHFSGWFYLNSQYHLTLLTTFPFQNSSPFTWITLQSALCIRERRTHEYEGQTKGLAHPRIWVPMGDPGINPLQIPKDDCIFLLFSLLSKLSF